MRLPQLLSLLGGLAISGVVGCAPPPGLNAANSATTPGWKIGHFCSPDETVQLVLDRSGPKIKMKVDGSSEIVELASAEVRSRVKSRLMGQDLFTKDGQRVLFIDVYGGVTFIRGHEELMIARVGDARPLGDATVIGNLPVVASK